MKLKDCQKLKPKFFTVQETWEKPILLFLPKGLQRPVVGSVRALLPWKSIVSQNSILPATMLLRRQLIKTAFSFVHIGVEASPILIKMMRSGVGFEPTKPN